MPNLYTTSREAEKAEVTISKHAMLEALFQTQLWGQPYVKNKFLYLSANPNDFDTPRGKELEAYFQNVFLNQYKKYNEALQYARRKK